MDVQQHNHRQIEMLNQRGGRTLSIVDLISAGPYPSVCQFLARLPGLPRHCAVERLQITADPDTDGCQVRLTLRLYFGAKGSAATTEDTKQKG